MNRPPNPFPPRERNRRKGMTLVEIVIAGAISSMVAVGLMSLSVTAGRLGRSINYQQKSLWEAKAAIEGLNREIRMATTPLRVVDDDGNAAQWGNRVEFQRLNEASGRRSIELVSDDNDLMTPWDNRLIFDPNTNSNGDEIELAQWLTPLDVRGAFFYRGVVAPLQIQMRCGDSLGVDDDSINDSHSGPGTQGMEISIFTAPRN